MRRGRNLDAGAEGFTLVETLVSLSLLALLAVYVLQSFQVMKQMDAMGERIQAQNEVEAATHMLKEEISAARVVFSDVGTPQQKLLFSGAEHSLTYVAASNGSREIGGLYLVHVFLNGDGALAMTRQLIRADNSVPIEAVTLIRGVQSLKFKYFARDDAAETLLSWQEREMLPASIETQVTFTPGDVRHWPETIAQTLLNN